MIAERKPKARRPTRWRKNTAKTARPRPRRPPRCRQRGRHGSGHGRSRPRLGGHGGNHQLHEHVEPERHDWRRALARNAVKRGLKVKPWVKTSLAPGSLVVTEYLRAAGLLEYLAELGFNIVGYGCTTCIGNSGPLPEPVSSLVKDRDLIVASILSGNRNFEGRIQSQVRANYLASPPLVVAYAIAGRMQVDLTTEPLGEDSAGPPVMLKDVWPSEREIQEAMLSSVRSEMFREQYAHVFDGDERWRSLPIPTGERFEWTDDSTYIRNPPFFEGITAEPTFPSDISSARALAVLGDSVTTDHISPAGLDSRRQSRRPLPDLKGRPAVGLQFVWRAARQPRSDDARHVRQHPPAQPARARHRRRMDDTSAGRRGDDHLRRVGEVSRPRRAADDRRRQGIRVGVVARLGGQGHAAARRQGGAGRELRTHPSQQPREHGRAAAAVP